MRGCLIILSLLLILCSAARAKDYSNKTHHCCTSIAHGSKNVTKSAPLTIKGMPERARRSIHGERDQRSKFSKALMDTSSKEFLPARGRRGNLQLLREMSSAENPFWAARGRRAFDSSHEDPFWAARGKKLLENSLEKDDPFWAARGKKLKIDSLEKEDPFWAARGKKLLEGSLEKDDPFWAARGKKLRIEASAENPFWAARGKKLLEASAENPFWAARGKKQQKTSAEDPFWAARGKKESSAENPFWAARGRRTEKSKEASASGSKENPFWAARGKRDDIKVDGSKEIGVLKPRANRQPGEEFWPARGKRPLSPQELGYWLSSRDGEEIDDDDIGFLSQLFGSGKGDDEDDMNIPDVVAQILGIKTSTQKIKKEMIPERQVPIVNPWYSTEFWATRG